MTIASATPELTHYLQGRTITVQNGGTVDWLGAAEQTLYVMVSNAGAINNQAGGVFRVSQAGDFVIAPGLGGGSFTNGGTVDVTANTNLAITAPLTSNGSLNTAVGTVLGLWNATLNNGTQLTGPGEIHLLGPATLNGLVELKTHLLTGTGSSLTLNENARLLVRPNANLDIAGVTTLKGAGLNARVDLEEAARMEIRDDLTIQNLMLKNDGRIVWRDGDINLVDAVAKINNDFGFFDIDIADDEQHALMGAGSFDNKSTGKVSNSSDGQAIVGIEFINAGTVSVNSEQPFVFLNDWTSSGTLELWTTLQVNGTFTNNGQVGITSEATFIRANLVVNNGRIERGTRFLGNSWSLSIMNLPGATGGGNFTQGATGVLVLSINDAPLPHDMLIVSGHASLDGTLTVSASEPLSNEPVTWGLIAYTSRTGQFTTVNRPPNFGLPVYGNNTMTITWAPPE